MQFIGTVHFGKNVVEHITLKVNTQEEASDLLSRYVYNTYNQDVPQGAAYFTGTVIDTSTLDVLTPESLPELMRV